ncbi:MAG: hypothetical protein PUC85_04550 [bacterium]|nr:hypothetical protein [bacterium]
MTDSLLDKISRSAKDGVITKWQNGQIGEIIDLQGNCVYRFIDYETDSNGNVWKKHLTEESELSCPIVAAGFVGYWLHHKNKFETQVIFENYYTIRLQQYEKRHAFDPDVWKRDLKKEFAYKWYILTEKRWIKNSESIFPYLTDYDKEKIQIISNEYIGFMREKKKEILQSSYPEHQKIEGPFLDSYRQNGFAWYCLKWFRTEYNFPWIWLQWRDKPTEKEVEFNTEKERFLFDSILPQIIREGHDSFDYKVLTDQQSSLMGEINENLKNCPTQEDRVRYLCTLLQPFQQYADTFHPIVDMNNCTHRIANLQQEIERLEKSNDLHSQKQIEDYKQKIQIENQELSYYENVMNCFKELADHGLYGIEKEGENLSMCECLNTWEGAMEQFGCKLAALALTYEIDLNEIQQLCGIYLFPRYDSINYVDFRFISSLDHVDQLLNKIKKQKQTIPLEQAVSSKKRQRQELSTDNTKKQKKGAPQKKKDYPPHTFSYYNYRDQSIYEKQQKRVDLVFQLLTQWRWIDEDTNPDNFDHLFTGEEIDCHIEWITNVAILTKLAKTLFKQEKYISRRTNVNATSLIKGQFKIEPDHKEIRIDDVDKKRIKLISFVLDITNQLPEQKDLLQYNADEACYQLKETALFEVYNKTLRSTKGI